MNRYYLRGLEYVIVIAVILAAIFLLSGKKKQDLEFCRDVLFGRLVAGSLSVEKFIDWDNFQGLGKNMGQDYKKMPNDKERKLYRKSFIKAFSAGFRENGGNRRAFINWRVYSQGEGKVIIAADYPSHKKILLFQIIKNGSVRKLSALEWKEEK